MDVTSKAVTEVLARTIEYLQPNPGRGTYQLQVVCTSTPQVSGSKESSGYWSMKKKGMGTKN